MKRCGICDKTDKPLAVCPDCHAKTTGELQGKIDTLSKDLRKYKKMFERQASIAAKLRKQCVRLNAHGREFYD